MNIFYLIIKTFNSEHVTVNFARSGGPGGQNVNKGEFTSSSFILNKRLVPILLLSLLLMLLLFCNLYHPCCYLLSLLVVKSDYCTVNTKVDMRFNVENAYWLSDRIREKIMQMVCLLSFLIMCLLA